MATGRAVDDSEHRRVQRAAQESRQADAVAGPGPDPRPEHSESLLGASRLGGRSHAPLRTAAMLGMQQPYGTRALQRFLKGRRSGGRRDSAGAPAVAQGAARA
jgi:hypothetical protein